MYFMESSVNRLPRREYLWGALAVICTLLLSAATHINLSFITAETESAKATFELLGFILRIAAVVPLLCVTAAFWSRAAWATGPLMLAILTGLSYGAGLMFEKSYTGALYYVGMIAPAGIILYYLQRYQFSNFYTVFYLSIAFLAGLFIRVSLPSLIENGDAFLPMKDMVEAYRTLWEASAEGLLSEEMISAMKETLTELKLGSDQYLIELLYYPSAFAALANVLLSHLLNRNGGAILVPLPSFEEWTVERGYVYGSLILTVISYILALSKVRYGSGLLQIAYLVWMLPMSLAGLCYLKKRTKGKTWLFVLLTILSISMYSIFGWALSLMGMIGFFRKEQERRQGGGAK